LISGYFLLGGWLRLRVTGHDMSKAPLSWRISRDERLVGDVTLGLSELAAFAA